MNTARRVKYTYAEYLTALKDSDIKLEYCKGEIYAMAGGTVLHATLAGRVTKAIGSQLPNGCEVLSSDGKIRIEATDLSTFPDVSVLCGAPQTSKIDSNALVNPVLLVEVTSPSTEDYDRGAKLNHYKQIPTVKAVLLVSYEKPRITLVRRISSGWEQRDFSSGEELQLDDPLLKLSVAGLYDGLGVF